MKKKTVYSSYKNGLEFKKTNGNKEIKGIKEKLKVLKSIDSCRDNIYQMSSSEIEELSEA